MAKRVQFGRTTGRKKGRDTSFNFGFNTLPKKQQRAYRKRVSKGGKGGGS